MREERDKPDRLVAAIAARQHGVISAEQLAAAGVGKDGVRRRVQAGRLHRVHRAVYAVGHPRLSFEGRCKAAELACGHRASISHRSAAMLWGLLPETDGRIHVLVAGTGGPKRRRGIQVHRAQTLGDGDLTRRKGIQVTTVRRTLIDLRRGESTELFQRAQRRALDLRFLGDIPPTDRRELTRSELERKFLRLCSRYRLPLPEVNSRVAVESGVEGPPTYEVDFLWRRQRVIVETDGFRYHGNRLAFEADRTKDARLQAEGYRVLRLAYRNVTDSPKTVAEAVRAALFPRPTDRFGSGPVA
jgi:hypothetical protein